MFEDMNITKANSRIEHLTNVLSMKKEEKEMIFPLPKSGNMSELVEGGIRNDKMLSYIIKSNSLDIEIDEIQKEIQMLERFVSKEKERISQYNEWEQKVIYMREERKTWYQIACSVPYSIRTCKRIWNKYKKGKVGTL